jgi:hypothetical protein
MVSDISSSVALSTTAGSSALERAVVHLQDQANLPEPALMDLIKNFPPITVLVGFTNK